MYSLGELRPGHAIILDGEPYLVVTALHSKQARGAGVLKTTVKNLVTGAVLPKTFQGSDKLEPAGVGFRKAQYLYPTGDDFEFMWSDDYEGFTMAGDILGEDAAFLTEGEEYDVQNFEGQPLRIQFPTSLAFEVVETVPGVKGDTASGGTKPATLSNGITVQVPLYVEEGDMLQISTETHAFQKRVQA